MTAAELQFPFFFPSLEEVKGRLKNTAEEVESSDAAVKKAEAEFEAIKKQRMDLFMAAFDRISNEIDGIYKVARGKQG